MREGTNLMRAVLLACCILATSACEKRPVLMSQEKICHDTTSPNYEQFKNPRGRYDTMQECEDAGGRKRKGSAPDKRPWWIAGGLALVSLVLVVLRRRTGARS